MLELRDIVKDYVSGNNVTHALKGISVNFRKNEFVSILGASGCGKTTTLNIIGGLDRYTSGDLLINGKSTKNYTDRDWDTYRNHSIGFIFQTYNLIGHQSILKNVELALTISGVSKAERKERAYEALKKVGLEGMEKKKPNQLSGGQCQRVAIARALINNPEILLADEPTGALDSETSIQIMDLLKEVASDRLVIMVTHNPDLAFKYSTRIIRMSDGVLTEDSNPFDGSGEFIAREINKGSKKQSSMSVKTATGLSLSNLVSKLKRTVLVTIAGSIGIIGVSAVLAVSRGVKDYIAGMQNDMLSSYPLEVAEETADYSSLMNGLNSTSDVSKFKFDPENPKVGIDSMIRYLMTAYSDVTKVKTNTINKELVAFIEDTPSDAVASKSYKYGIDVTNNIFGEWKKNKETESRIYSLNGLVQSYIAELKTVKGFSDYAKYVSLFTNFMNQLPNDKEYVLEQYDVIAGETPTFSDDELIFVVDKNTTMTDLALAEMGLYEHDDFLNIAKKAIKENEVRKDDKLTDEEKEAKYKELDEKYKYKTEFSYDELIGRTYSYVKHDNMYEYGTVAETRVDVIINGFSGSGLSNFKMYSGEYDKTQDLWTLTISGLSSSTSILLSRDVSSPKPSSGSDIDLAVGTWVGVDDNGTTYNLVLTKDSNFAQLKINDETTAIMSLGAPVVTTKTTTIEGYNYNAEYQTSYGEGKKLKIKSILRLKDDRKFGCLQRGVYYPSSLGDKYIEDNKDAEIVDAVKAYITLGDASQTFNAYVRFKYLDQTNPDAPIERDGYATSLNGAVSNTMTSLMSAFTGGGTSSNNETHLRTLSGQKTVYHYNSETKEVDDITFEKLPQRILIYPKSFDSKSTITNHLDKWNQDGVISVTVDGVKKDLAKKDRDQLTYTDTIQMIITVINTLINAVTTALVAFTSLSLLVSCFMIAVITYISVVERIKEIGVIRSLGGRKRDVANLFVMENLLTGLFSGVFGIGITYILQIIFNIILKSMFKITIANLTIPTALIMIGVSIVLSVISGLIPSQSAAHKDPVVALRSNE